MQIYSDSRLNNGL